MPCLYRDSLEAEGKIRQREGGREGGKHVIATSRQVDQLQAKLRTLSRKGSVALISLFTAAGHQTHSRLSKEDLSMVEEAGKQLPPKSWFTTSFDKRAARSKCKKAIFKTRLRSVRKVLLLRGNRFGQCVSRIGLSMTFASGMPVLGARNATFFLEEI